MESQISTYELITGGALRSPTDSELTLMDPQWATSCRHSVLANAEQL